MVKSNCWCWRVNRRRNDVLRRRGNFQFLTFAWAKNALFRHRRVNEHDPEVLLGPSISFSAAHIYINSSSIGDFILYTCGLMGCCLMLSFHWDMTSRPLMQKCFLRVRGQGAKKITFDYLCTRKIISKKPTYLTITEKPHNFDSFADKPNKNSSIIDTVMFSLHR